LGGGIEARLSGEKENRIRAFGRGKPGRGKKRWRQAKKIRDELAVFSFQWEKRARLLKECS